MEKIDRTSPGRKVIFTKSFIKERILYNLIGLVAIGIVVLIHLNNVMKKDFSEWEVYNT